MSQISNEPEAVREKVAEICSECRQPPTLTRQNQFCIICDEKTGKSGGDTQFFKHLTQSAGPLCDACLAKKRAIFVEGTNDVKPAEPTPVRAAPESTKFPKISSLHMAAIYGAGVQVYWGAKRLYDAFTSGRNPTEELLNRLGGALEGFEFHWTPSVHDEHKTHSANGASPNPHVAPVREAESVDDDGGEIVILCDEHGFRNCSVCNEDRLPDSKQDGFLEWLDANSEGMEGEDDTEKLMHVAWRGALVMQLPPKGKPDWVIAIERATWKELEWREEGWRLKSSNSQPTMELQELPRPEYRFERHSHSEGRGKAIFWEDEILSYFASIELALARAEKAESLNAELRSKLDGTSAGVPVDPGRQTPHRSADTA